MKAKLKVATLVIVMLSVTGCTKKPNTNPTPTPERSLRTLKIQLDRAAVGLNTFVDVKRALLAEGIITREQSHDLTQKLEKFRSALVAFVRGVDAVQDFKEGETRFSAFYSELKKVFDDLTAAQGLIKLPGESKSKVDLLLNIIGVALSVIEPLVKGRQQ